MADSGLMPHEVDRHLVAGGIYLNRVDRELEKLRELPEGTIPAERTEKFEELCSTVQHVIDLLEELRTGRPRTKRPTTLADVSDLDAYRKNFIEG